MLLITFVNKLINSLKSKQSPKIKFFYNKLILQLLQVLKNKNYLEYKIIDKRSYPSPLMEIDIIKTKIKNLTFISKPSIKRTTSYRDLMKLPFECILSTDKGLMTKKEAINNKVGGTVLIKVHLKN